MNKYNKIKQQQSFDFFKRVVAVFWILSVSINNLLNKRYEIIFIFLLFLGFQTSYAQMPVKIQQGNDLKLSSRTLVNIDMLSKSSYQDLVMTVSNVKYNELFCISTINLLNKNILIKK